MPPVGMDATLPATQSILCAAWLETMKNIDNEQTNFGTFLLYNVNYREYDTTDAEAAADLVSIVIELSLVIGSRSLHYR